MERFSIQNYKDLTIEYYILSKTKEFLNAEKINLKDLIRDNFTLFESEIGDDIDGKDWKKFKIVYYGIIKRLLLNKKGEFKEKIKFEEKFNHNNKKVLIDSYYGLKNEKIPFAVKYKILVNQKNLSCTTH